MGVGTWWRARRARTLMDRSLHDLRSGRFGEAEAAAREAANIRAEVLGPAAPQTFACRLVVARALYFQQRWAATEQEVRECLALSTATGTGSPVVAQLRTLLASTLCQACRLAEAETEARAAIAARPEGADPGEETPHDVLAMVLGDQGHHAEAAELLETIAAARASRVGAGHPLVLKGRSDRLQCLAYLGRHEEFDAEADALRAAAAELPGVNGVLVSLAVANARAFSLNLRGRFPEAVDVLGPALAKSRQGLRADRFERVLRLGLARALTGQGQAEAAIEEVEAAQTLYDRRPQVGHDLSAIHLARADALLALGRAAEAEQESRRCLTVCEQSIGARHHRTLEARTVLGEALAATGRTAEATACLDAVATDWDTHFGSGHHGTVRARTALQSVGTPGWARHAQVTTGGCAAARDA
ncbi:hypothetical protein GCM10010440_14590 [Kitasatospora cinereorecta]